MERKSIKDFLSATAPVKPAYRQIAAGAPPQAIHSEADYRAWRHVLNELLATPEEDMTQAEAAYAETVALLIEAYERARYRLPELSPEEVLAELMESHNLKQNQLVDVFGSEAAVSYAVNGKRPLTMEQVRKLSEKFHVSPALFIGVRVAAAR